MKRTESERKGEERNECDKNWKEKDEQKWNSNIQKKVKKSECWSECKGNCK
jgi:hypothetical protein